MFKYSIYDKALSLTKLVDKADSMKINYLETGNFLFQDGDFISWDHLEDIRNLLIESQKIIINIHTEVPYYEVDFHKELFKRAVLLGVKCVQPLMDLDIATDPGKQDAFFELCTVAKAYNIDVLVENRAGETAVINFFEDLFKNDLTVKPKFIFNPAEYVKEKVHPFFHRFYRSRLKNDILIMRVNDCLYKTKKAVLPNGKRGSKGNGVHIISTALTDGFQSGLMRKTLMHRLHFNLLKSL